MSRLVAAILPTLSSLLLAAPADPLPLGKSLAARFDEKGSLRIETPDGRTVASAALRFWLEGRYHTQAEARPAEPPADTPRGRAFHAVLRHGSTHIHFWQLATPSAEGLILRFAIASGLAPSDEVAFGLELPVGTFQGATCSLPPDHTLTLPAAPPADPRLVEQDNTAITISRDSLALTLQRQRPGKIIVQDARKWHNPRYETLLYANPGVGDPPGWRSLAILITPRKTLSGPVIAAAVATANSVPRYGILETEVILWAPHANPFCPDQVRLRAEVTTPSGRAFDAEGFLSRDYRITPDKPNPLPVGLPRWLVRIAPTEVGKHSYTLELAAAGKTTRHGPLAFSATPSRLSGFVAAPKPKGSYLVLDRKPFIPIGHNYCWPQPTATLDQIALKLRRMASARLNATRLWLCSWGLAIEGNSPDNYRLDAAWKLDRLLQAAAEAGIRVQLCLDNLTDLTAPEKIPLNPYFAYRGGPCREPADFFTSPQARAQHQRRLRYLVSRYAPYRSLLAWELFNEIAYAVPAAERPAALAWIKETAAWLRKRDPYRHPVTVGVGLGTDWTAPWELPEIAIAQPHVYIHRPLDQREEERDGARLIAITLDKLRTLAKPILIAETGYLGTADFNPLNEADPTGVQLHNAIWSSLMAGGAGAAMAWWWDAYITRRDLRYHYTALANFLRHGPLPRDDWEPVRSDRRAAIRVLGLKGPDAAILWVQRPENNWYRRVVQARPPVPTERTAIELEGLRDGTYRVEWWDTYGGQPLTETRIRSRGGRATLLIPPGHPDLACKILPAAP